MPDRRRGAHQKVEADSNGALYIHPMKLRQKIILFAVMPLVLALCGIALIVRHHAISLAQQEREVIKPAYLATKEAELMNYVALATRAIDHLYKSGKTDAVTKEGAKAILKKLEYGNNGYFFLYDLEGTLLMHPKLQESVGKNMWDFKDPTGKPIIQDLIRLARNGGGFHNYVWEKYSTGTPEPKAKRAYVIELPAWGWMLGTGVYLDDVDNALSKIDSQVSRNIDNTMLWIAGIAFLSTVAIFLGLMRNIRERTVMDDKLSAANTELEAQADRLSVANAELEAQANRLSITNAELEVQKQRAIVARHEERTRMKKDLHDGIQPMLAAVKMRIETGVMLLPRAAQKTAPAQITFEPAAEQLKDTLRELRRIIEGINLPPLDLVFELNKITRDMSHAAASLQFNAIGEIPSLTSEANEALLLIAKEALNNVWKHAAAHHASVQLEGTRHYVKLAICDDGRGFDVDRIDHRSGCAIGLGSMKERLEAVGGQLTLTASSSGTTVTATIPLP